MPERHGCQRIDDSTGRTPSVNVDGVFLHRPAREAFAAGDFNQVPVFAGFNANEGVLFTFDMGIETNDDLQEALVEWGEYYGLSDPALETTYTPDVFRSPQQTLMPSMGT